MPRVTDAHRQARRLQIAEAALRCFGRKGFQGTSMADIIAESGLSAGAIYGHFRSKDELIEVAVREILDHLLRELNAFRTSDPLPEPREVLKAFLQGIGEDIIERGLLLQVWAEAMTDPGLRRVAAGTVTGLKELFAGYLITWYTKSRGLTPAEASTRAGKYAAVMLGVCQGFIVQSALIPGFDAEEYLAGLGAITPA
ncbi:TetR/AcrR family transcriptional regulator [Pseudarthrobacter albicanus]|uniref:TetR/AcrR family transcriptional regulator n=1 Tax=Pseudarthrobacter albicanus TaxID=2823873 RepID=UPI001BABD661|nr:TetR family transcriptional regulator [Pseudarthrobacter albicanus]